MSRWHCGETRLARTGASRTCVLDTGHDGHHQDSRGDVWPDPAAVLAGLQDTYGDTHRISWTGRLWVAVHRDPRAEWRTEIEPTPEQLEERLRTRQAAPVPQQRSHP
ncbi:hypothetical protein [Nocardiopsis protaetiae]|uniref:hypothetical protein n=1 Tax=Nocardiopsis protaetiae TaxID=3382270 RepID=UPI00387B7188